MKTLSKNKKLAIAICAVMIISTLIVTSLVLVKLNYKNEETSGVYYGNQELQKDKVYPLKENIVFTKSLSSMSDTGVILSATILPETAANKEVDWEVAWVKPNAEFAKNKSVTDYLKITPTSDGALTANVSCKSSFGEKIKISVISRENVHAKAECTADYLRKLKSTSILFKNIKDNRSFEISDKPFKLLPIELAPGEKFTDVYGERDTTTSMIYNFDEVGTLDNEVIAYSLVFRNSAELIEATKNLGYIINIDFPMDHESIQNLNYYNLLYMIAPRDIFSGGYPNLEINTNNYNNYLKALGQTKDYDFEMIITTTLKIGGEFSTRHKIHIDHSSKGLAVTDVEMNTPNVQL